MKLMIHKPGSGGIRGSSRLEGPPGSGARRTRWNTCKGFAVATHWRAVPGRRAARVTALPDMFVSVSYFANHPMRRLCIALLCKLKLRCLFSRLASLNKLRKPNA